jgi:NAD(P)-dependent dehydrogenase (short-subunit alcohol dehydrogenase family)
MIMSSPVVLITGGLTGIGRATAIAFAKAGGQVVVSGRQPDAGEAFANELRVLGSEAEFVEADVRREEDVRRLVDRTVKRFGIRSSSRRRIRMRQPSTPTCSGPC